MLESLNALLQRLWRDHPGKLAGTLSGVLLGASVLIFGFWEMLFVLLMGLLGLFIGMNVDREGDTWQNIKEFIPKDIHRLR